MARLWASRRIGVLIDQLRQAGAGSVEARPSFRAAGGPASLSTTPVGPVKNELIDEIVRLSVKFGILTEYTAFLALEGTDLSRSEVLARRTADNVRNLAVRRRSGAHAVSQEDNNFGQQGQTVLNGYNGYVTKDRRRVEFTGIQQVADLAFFNRGARWLDSRLVTRKLIKPDEVIRFGTPRFDEVLKRLGVLNRVGVTSLGGRIDVIVDGKVLRLLFPLRQDKEK